MSNSQKYINIVSILNIIAGAIFIVLGIVGFAGKSAVTDAALIEQAGTAEAPAMANAFLIGMIASGALSLITGILGVRAAKDATKVKPVLILSGISLAIVVIGLIGSAISGGFSASGLLELVAPGLMFWCANNVKKQAGI